MTDKEQKRAAKEFAKEWKDKGYEKGESQPFWLSLLRDVLGVEHPEQFIKFEEQVHLDHTSFIDGYIPSTKVLIEQKGNKKNLNQPIKQSDGSLLTPFQQAKRYITELPVSQHPRWVVTCNFTEFYVYDMERPGGEPEKIQLANLDKDYYRLSFLTTTENIHIHREMEVSMKAGEIVVQLYDLLKAQYINPDSEETLQNLNKLCVRLVFCLYAEDAGIFGRKEMFHDYLSRFETEDLRFELVRLFKVLDTKPEDRDPYMKPSLAEFPYVNGGLFRDENIVIPQMTDEIKDLLLNKASIGFDWLQISPTIFGAVFESTLNPETRRKGGMHYTSIENIHKVIDPLFLDDLKKELEEIEQIKVLKTKEKKLREFQDKLASLTFLDPACGSGNFLTETYLSLRRLENQVLTNLYNEQIVMGITNPIKVSINQFYGIEINDFAVTVAKTALWIAESQTMKETESIVQMDLDFLPLKTNAHIHEGNALRLDWNNVIPNDQLKYIMSNPPFVGKKEQNSAQKKELTLLFDKSIKGIGNVDYVSGWYIKAINYMHNTKICAAFVSTNSITQGEQVLPIWTELLTDGIEINFAYPTFRWDSEATLKAHVHCVIIGFSSQNISEPKMLYFNNYHKVVHHINPYLLEAPDILIHPRLKPISNCPTMAYGNMPIDNGNLILDEHDVKILLNENPNNQKYLRQYIGGAELIKGTHRWCLWLKGATPQEIRQSRFISERVRKNKDYRASSHRKQTLILAETPTLFGEIRQPNSEMLVLPKVSSEKRKYLPMAFVAPDIIVNGSALLISHPQLIHFGILISSIHMAWMKTVGGRLEMRYQYSKDIVYNNFPWPNPTPSQQTKIEQTAQAILDARDLYPDSSLADLYDELTMPPELRKAHQENDKAVLAAYGITPKDEAYHSESACVAFLMKRYQEIVDKLSSKEK